MPVLTPIDGPSGAGHRGATTAIIWITRDDEPEDVLVYGTQSGHLVVWKEVHRHSQVRIRGSKRLLGLTAM